ncbi:MAG: universal stress protein [Fibrobacteria bacterium]
MDIEANPKHRVNMKILIGYDGSPESEVALNELGIAGLPDKVRAIILFVAPLIKPDQYTLPLVGLGKDQTRMMSAAKSNAETSAAKAAAHLKTMFPTWEITSEAILDSPAQGLLNRANSWKPDLVALGSRNRSAIGKFLMGSVTTKVIYDGNSNIRMARMRKRTSAAPRIFIEVDGNPGSDSAVSIAASRSWPVGTHIRILTVSNENGFSKSGKDRITPGVERKTSHSRLVESKSMKAVKLFASNGVKADFVALMGDPRIVILREIKMWGCDCIFVGSRGISRIKGFVLGSVSSAIASYATCTVEIVRK